MSPVLRRYRLRALLLAVPLIAVLGLLIAPGTRAGAAPGPGPTVGPPTIDISPQPPTAPAGLHSTAVTSRSVTLAWTASSGGCCGVSGYDLTYTQAFNDVVLTQQLGNVTTVTVATLVPTGQYNFRVTARDDVGHRSASSNSVTVVTPKSDTAADQNPPTAPSGLVSAGYTPAGVLLSWTGSTDDVGVTGYNVYRFDGLYISTLLGTTTGTSFTAPSAGVRDIFYVRAADAAGNLSASSNIVSTTGPTPSTTPTAAPACRVTYQVTSQWSGGYVADVTVANTAATPVTDWALTFTYGGDQRVSSAWNASFSQTGRTVTLTGARWNRTIAAGGSVTAGVLGRWSASNATPTAATLNGSPCVLA